MIPKFRPLILAALVANSLSTLSAQSPPPTPQGVITVKEFLDIAGTATTAITASPKFPNSPDVITFAGYFEWPQSNPPDISITPPTGVKDNYGTQIVGFFYPLTTGEYTFYLASDDNSVLYLSTDATAANKKLIAQETVWSNPRQYAVSGGNSNLAAKDSSQFAGTQWPTLNPSGGAAITLTAGQPYYIEALAKEGGGGDNLSVSIDGVGPIPGDRLSSDRTNGPTIIAQHPQSQSIPERGSVTFRVLPNGTPPYSYQWRKNGTNILGATTAAYRIPVVSMTDSGAKYSVFVTGPGGSAPSNEATLTVTPDTTAPQVMSAKGSPNLTEVLLTFSEVVTNASASLVSNYSISSVGGPLTVTGATLSPSGTSVVLTTATQTAGTKYSVLINGLQDTAAAPNSIPANSKAVFLTKGKLTERNGMIVFEAESYDRNLDGLWVPDTNRGTPSGGVSMVVPNGAGGSESATKLEYDVEFAQAGTYYVWYLASGPNGSDDSIWFHLDGARPIERAGGNQASMTGFSTQANFVWRSDAQDPPDPFTVEIPSAGPHVVAVARREDGSFIDKMILTTNSAFTPTGLGPAETRDGLSAPPTISLTAPTTGQTFTAGANITLSATAAGDLGLGVTRVEFSANGSVIGVATASPFTFTWNAVPAGIYSLQAVATDEIGASTASASVAISVGGPGTGPRIAFVTYHSANGTPSAAATTAGFTRAVDVAYTELLEANGYKVTRVLTTGTPDTAFLNAFDLVMISRSVPSGDYQDTPETAAWNGVTAPMMILNGYILRNNRLGFTSGGTMPDTLMPVRLEVRAPAHPIFAGISRDAGNITVNPYAEIVSFNGIVQRGVSVNNDPLAGDGTILATIGTPEDPAAGGTVIAEWQAGAVLGNASANALGGKRLVFLTGSRESNGLTAHGAGIFDLTADGSKMFLNAVSYMTGAQPPPPAPTISVLRTAQGLQITFTGTLQSSDDLLSWTNVVGTSPQTVTITTGKKFFRAKR